MSATAAPPADTPRGRGSGGARERRFLAGLYRRHGRVVAASFGLDLLAALAETSTVGILVLAVETLLGEPGAALGGRIPGIGDWLAGLDRAVGRDGTFLVLVGLAVVAQLSVSGLDFLSRAANATLQSRVEGDLRKRIFRHLVRLPFARVMRQKVGDLASYNEQVGCVGLVTRLLHLVAGQSVMLVAYLAVLFWLSWPMATAALVAAVGLSLGLRRIVGRIRALGSRFTESTIRVSERLIEFLNGLRLVRTFARERYAMERMAEAVDESVAYRRRGLVWNASIGPLADSLTIVGVAAFLVAGHLLLGAGASGELPRLVAFLFVLHRMMPQVRRINDHAGQIGGYWEFVRRVSDLLAEELPPRGGGRQPFDGLRRGVEFRDVGLDYGTGEGPALAGVSFTLPCTGMVALVGPSGAGKTSLADLLLGLFAATTGSILVDGRELATLDWRTWRRHLGVVSQEAFLLHASIRENIAFGRLDATDDEIEAAATLAQADEFIRDLADGYHTVVGDRGYRLSGGQRQRLAIARAVLRDPDVLVLDEATSHLDSESERLIQAALGELRRERAILVIAHRLSTLVEADQIVVLDRGRVIERGTHRELVDRGGRYARYWTLQSTLADPRAAIVDGPSTP